MDGHYAGPGVTDTGEQPVFVDQTGQRRRLTLFAGVSIAVGLVVSIGLIIAGLFGGSPVPLPGWPDANVQRGEGTPPLETIILTPTPIAPETGGETTPTPQAEPSTSQPAPQTTSDRPGGANPTTDGPGRRPSKSPGKPK